MKYKVGDIVKINSLVWYNKNSEDNSVINNGERFTDAMVRYCGRTTTITGISNDSYDLDLDDGDWCWYDWMLEDEPTVSEQLKEKRFQAACSAINGVVSELMQSDEWHGWTDKHIAERAYSLADELLKQGGFTE